MISAPLTVLLFLLLAAACSAEDSSPASSGGSNDGAALYASNCASCHGTDLRGKDKGPSHLSIVYEPSHHGDDAFRAAIRVGAPRHHWTFGDMPAINGLDDEEVEAIIEYVRSEQERLGFEP